MEHRYGSGAAVHYLGSLFRRGGTGDGQGIGEKEPGDLKAWYNR